MLPSLEVLCQQKYLEYLEVECHTWIHLKRSSSFLFRNAVDQIIPTLKRQLAAHMSGTSSTNIRSAMMVEILSGKYPTERFRNTITAKPTCNIAGSADSPSQEKMQLFMSKARDRTANCVNICCSGAFIVEAMCLVVMNDEIKELSFDPDLLKKAWKPGAINEYVPFNYPALLASYKDSVKEVRTMVSRPNALERIKIGRFDLLLSQQRGLHVLKSFNNTHEYLKFMKYLGPRWSWDTNIWEPDHEVIPSCDWPASAGDKNGYLPNAQHAMYALTDLFMPKWAEESMFERLTEICLSSDFVTNFCEQDGTPLFSAMGHAAPNLRVLDLSGLIRLRSESILYLFFHDAFQTLHQYMYLHEHTYQPETGQTVPELSDMHNVRKHTFDRYCPWCCDEGAANSVRAGCEFNFVSFSVIDSRLWDFIEKGDFGRRDGINIYSKSVQEVLIKHSLKYSVSSRDLYRSVTAPRMTLLRESTGAWPYENGYKPDPGMENRMEFDGLEAWYPPADIKYMPVAEDKTDMPPIFNRVAKSLQILKMPYLSLKGEIVPFLLKVCPKLKTLGHGGSIPYGLQLLSDLLEEEGLPDIELKLEEVEIDFDFLSEEENKPVPDYQESTGSADSISSNSPNYGFLLNNFGRKIFKPLDVNDSNSDDDDGDDDEADNDDVNADNEANNSDGNEDSRDWEMNDGGESEAVPKGNSEDEEVATESAGLTPGEETARQFAIRVYKQAALYAPDLDIEARISNYVDLLVRFVKRLKRLSLYLASTFDVDIEPDTKVWERLHELEHLTELELRYARFEDVTGLIRSLGRKLKKLKTSCLPSRHSIAELMTWMLGGTNSELQYGLIVCENCPFLEELDCNSPIYIFHFGRQVNWVPGHFSYLRYLHVGYITWDTLLQVWNAATALETLKLSAIAESPTIANINTVPLDRQKIALLFANNKMRHLHSLLTGELEFRSYDTAHLLVSQLPSLKNAGKIIISEDILNEPEDDAVMTMDQWTDWLKTRQEDNGLNVVWTNKYSFGEI